MSSSNNKFDSNLSGLRYAEESEGSIGELPNNPVWRPLEPNRYGEFGGQTSTTARAPINPSRQRRKGVITDLSATAGFQSDFVERSLFDLMQGFFFADWREKQNERPTAVTGSGYTVASGATSRYKSNNLILVKGFATPANNGLKSISTSSSTSVQTTNLVAEANPPADASITVVAVQAESSDLAMEGSANAGWYLSSSTLDFTDLGLIPGEWIFIGGDVDSAQFAQSGNNGFYRIRATSDHRMDFDRTPGNVVADNGNGKGIAIYFGHVIKNESDPNRIKCRSYQMERTISADNVEYVKGCVANTMEIRVTSADKVTVDLGFIGIDSEALDAQKNGSRPHIPEEEAFNSSSDFSRLRMMREDPEATLFTYLTDLSLSINNNVTPSKSIGVLGSFDVTAGDFVAAGSVTAYYSSNAAVKAVRDNADVSLDFAMVKDNSGWLFDVPYLMLGDGRTTVEKDAEVRLPLTIEGAGHPDFDHTMLAVYFPYLPDLAS